MHSRYRGFTLVELIVVIAVIGILATVAVVGLGRYQADTRDAKRATSVAAISEALEKYYDQNGEYPSCSKVTAAGTTVSQATLQGISPSTLVAPQAPASTDNSLSCATLSIDGTDLFQYTGDGSTACTGTASCLKYTLSYKKEADQSIVSVQSRRNTSIATSGAATISIASTNFDNIGVSWTEIPNASDYLVQRCTAADCGAGSITNIIAPSTPPLTTTASGLNISTPYWFRVKANSTSSEGAWSNIAAATTKSMATPVLAATANSNSQITTTWGPIANVGTYTLEYSKVNDNFATGVTAIPGITNSTTSRAVTGLETGVPYYFRLKAVNGAFESSWSATATATTFVPAPATIAATVNSVSQITVNWAAVAVPGVQYRLERSDNNFGSVATTWPNTSATSIAATGLQQGKTHYFRVFAVVGSAQSNASSTASGTTPLDGPALQTYYAARNEGGLGNTGWAGYWLPGVSFGSGAGNYNQMNGVAVAACPAGSTPVYYMTGSYSPGNPGPYSSGWSTTGNWHMVSAYSPYYGIFSTYGRCDGPNASSGQVYWGNRCVRYTGAALAC